MKEDFFFGFLLGIIFSLFMGIFVVTDDDINADKIQIAAKVCGGVEKISKFDTDGEDTFVCIDGKEYGFIGSVLFTSAYKFLEKKEGEKEGE